MVGRERGNGVRVLESLLEAGRWGHWRAVSLLQHLLTDGAELSTRLPFGPLVGIRDLEADSVQRFGITNSGFHIPVWIVLVGRLVVAVRREFAIVFDGCAFCK